jgi:hypothetical protein
MFLLVKLLVKILDKLAEILDVFGSRNLGTIQIDSRTGRGDATW